MAKSGGSGVKKGWGSLGGNTPMHSFSGSGSQKPASSSQQGTGGRRDQAAPTGGSHGFYSSSVKNRDFAGTQVPGQSASKTSGSNDKFASGGKTKMFGNRGSLKVEGGRSSH